MVKAEQKTDCWLIESTDKWELERWCKLMTGGMAQPDEKKNARGYWQTEIPPDFWNEEVMVWNRMAFGMGLPRDYRSIITLFLLLVFAFGLALTLWGGFFG